MRVALGLMVASGLLIAVQILTSDGAKAVPVQSIEEQRKQANQLFNDGNIAEALALYRPLALNSGNAGKLLAGDFGLAVDCLNRLNRVNEFDAFIEAAVTAHAGDWRLLKRSAESLQGQVDQNGFLVAGEFHRGHHRGGGEWVSSSNRDRVRALQLLLQAEPLLKADDSAAASERSYFYQQLANTVRNIGNGESWRLQDLTDTAVLPDYDKNADGYYGRFGGFGGSSGGAPVDENGQPVFHQLPESWAAAKSDGERWRWAMNMAIQVDRSRTSELELQWAQFLLNEFGVQTADYVSPPVVILRADEQADDDQQTPEDADTHAVHLLPDSETVARLVNGTKRFTLPDEYNHITVLKRIAARNDSYRRQALETLVGVRMARHQYPQAAALLKEVLVLAAAGDDRDNVQRQIDQIEKNWVQFESVRTQVAGSGAVIDVRFRNGAEMAFSARPIDVSLLLRDTMTYLQSRPQELDRQKIQIEHIGHRLIQEGQEKYLGPPTANWSLTVQPPELHFDGVQTVTTPLQQPGAYWLTAKMKDGNEARVVIWVADTTITRKRVEDGTLYFIADAESGSPVANADLEFFGWRQEFIRDGRRYELYTKRFADRANGDGLCVPAADQLENRFQWLSIVRTKDGRLAYDGFNRIWNPDRIDVLSYSPTKVYTITDRPVYRPGHTVKFRQWVRRPKFHDDTADFADRDYWIQIRNPKGDIVHEVKARTDRWAGIDGEWTLPVDATLGHYTLAVAEEVTVNRRRPQPPNSRPNVPPPLSQPETVEKRIIGQGTFRVEEYRKPEFEVTIDAPDKPVMLGEKIQAKVNARYYFGAPVAEGTVHYKVERTPKDSRWYPVARWDWLYSPGYWWFAPDYNWYPGWYRWGCLAPIPPWRGWHPDPPEVVVEGDAELQPDGTFLIDIDTHQALADHSDSDHNYSITAEVVDQSRRTIIGNGSVLVAREPYKVFVWTDRGHYRTGDTVNVGIQARTPDGKGVSASGKVSLLSVTYGDDNKPVEQEVSAFDVATDDSGAANLKLVMPSAGQYRVRVSLTDGEGHQQEGGYVLFVRGPNADGRGYRFNDLELITEKREYQPGETATLQVNTNKTDGTVLLFVRPANGLCPKPVVLKLNGKSTTFDVNIQPTDMPNIFVEALTVADGRLHSEVREIVVPPEPRVANVEVLPSAERYRPGEEATVRLKLTDIHGNPFVGNTVLSVYDASLEYIAASAIPEIRSFFWNVRRHHNVHNDFTFGQYSGPIQLPDEIAMQYLFSGSEFGGGGGGMGGFGGGFPEREVFFNIRRGGSARMLEADSMMMAPMAAPAMAMEEGMAFGVASKAASAPAGEASAEAQPTVRSNFADTAYWLASAVSDNNGIVEVKFSVPDNLTTWKIKAWALGDGTRVGSGDSDIISSKDLIIRPQTPRFFTETDTITLSAVVHNYLTNAKSCRVVLETEGGQLQLLSDAQQVVEIPAGGETRVDWNVSVVSSGTVRIRMKALTDEESDAAEYSVPVKVHGLRKTESFTGVIRPDGQSASVTVRVPEKRLEEQSRLEIRYSPSLAGAMIDALPYLIDYPYGCTEQTLNRFLPAVITQQTLKQMGVNLAAVKDQRFQLNAAKTHLGKFPAHWGQPPEIQTRDLRPLPGGFGQGSSTLAAWIQQHLDEDAKKLHAVGSDFNPVFDEAELNRIVTKGVTDLTNMQLSDGGWGWFSGYGEHSTAHLTSLVVHGLTVAQKNNVPIVPDVVQRGVEWLKRYQVEQLELLREGDWRREHPAQLKDRKQRFKDHADNMDAFVAFVLSEHQGNDAAMSAYLFRDRQQLSVYAMALTGLVLHAENSAENRDLVLRNIEQFLEQDDENQTAWLRLPQSSWWYWYGSEYEAMSRYLQLLLKVEPQSERASRLVKYLLNNRQNGTYWKSTRDTALVVEAMADYIAATGEDKPQMTVEVLIDGRTAKTVTINGENFFSFDNSVLLEGAAVTSGEHKIELRRTGTGPLYFNAYLTNFTKEDHITAAGLEVRVDRRFYRLERDDKNVSVQGDRGQVVKQQTAAYKRIPLENLDTVTSGELIEVELVIDSKNDYEYLLLEDPKPSGFELDDQRSGYVWESLRAYRELRDDRVCFFLSTLARGQHSISYRLRAETPSQQVSAMPSVIEGMYSPELVGNSDEFKLRVNDR